MTDSVSKEMLTKLDLLIGLMAISVLDGKPQKEQIELLDKAGLRPKEIAALVGTTRNTVSVTLSQMKKRNSKPKTKKPKGKEGPL